MKLPTVPTVYYCKERNQIVLIEPSIDVKIIKRINGQAVEFPAHRIQIKDCFHNYFEDKSYLNKNWPYLVKIGEL